MVGIDQVLEKLSTVIDPDLKKDIVSMGMIKNLELNDGNLKFTLELTTTGWQITGDTYYGYVCLSGTALTRIDYTGYKVKILLWK